MPRFGPISRRRLIACLRELGFTGPYRGGGHQYMLRPGGLPLSIPNPHQGDISIDLLDRILRQGGISRDEWERL